MRQARKPIGLLAAAGLGLALAACGEPVGAVADVPDIGGIETPEVVAPEVATPEVASVQDGIDRVDLKLLYRYRPFVKPGIQLDPADRKFLNMQGQVGDFGAGGILLDPADRKFLNMQGQVGDFGAGGILLDPADRKFLHIYGPQVESE